MVRITLNEVEARLKYLRKSQAVKGTHLAV